MLPEPNGSTRKVVVTNERNSSAIAIEFFILRPFTV
jgi:hypothetical protein